MILHTYIIGSLKVREYISYILNVKLEIIM